jgi:trigger factor
MQITVETVGLCRKRIQLVIPPERVKEEVNEYIRQASTTLRIPGFRPGHVPRAVVEQRYGKAIRKDVKESLVNDGYQQALKEHNIQPLSTPQVDLEAIPLDEKNGLKIDFELDTRPEFEPKDYKGLAATAKPVSVSDEDVAKQIEEIKNHRRRPTKDEAAAIEGDSFAIASIEFTLDGKSILQRDSVRVRLGMTVSGADPEAFQKALAGKKVGDSFEFDVTYPDDFEVAQAHGKSGKCKLTIREVYRLVPPADADLLKDLDVPDLDALRADVRRRVQEAREAEERRRVEEELVDLALKANPFELPDRIVDQQVETRIAQHEEHSAAEGGDPNNRKPEDLDEARKKLRPDMEKGLRRLFLLEAIARKEKLFVTEDDMTNELRGIAERNQSSLDEVARYYQQQNLLPALRLDLLENKVRHFLVESSKKAGA